MSPPTTPQFQGDFSIEKKSSRIVPRVGDGKNLHVRPIATKGSFITKDKFGDFSRN